MRGTRFTPIVGLAAAILTSVGLAIGAPQANAESFTFGKTTDGTWDFPVIAGELRVYKHSLTRAGRIDSLSILIRGGSSAQTLKLVLYAVHGERRHLLPRLACQHDRRRRDRPIQHDGEPAAVGQGRAVPEFAEPARAAVQRRRRQLRHARLRDRHGVRRLLRRNGQRR
jgi:hypothetical protein